jgi:hypothetical protein
MIDNSILDMLSVGIIINNMINKKWSSRFGLALYWAISILWIALGIFLTYYYQHTQAGIDAVIASGQQKYPAICFVIGLGTSPLIPVNYLFRLFVFGLGIVAIEAGII